MTTFNVALLAVLGLWFSPFLLVALWLVRDHRRNGRDVQARADQLAAAPASEWEQHTWTAPSTYAGGLRLVERPSNIVDLDSRRRHGTGGGAA